MASDTSTARPKKASAKETLTFDVSTGLKRVLGSELITDDEVAIFELVKNSFDAGATKVHIFFGASSVIVADNGRGMSTRHAVKIQHRPERVQRPPSPAITSLPAGASSS
ncbi:MAG: ATP-binding protein [Bradyrhizobium sp.]|uniref:ATP-binding protein n=1 Tax=Bradyrhizobium sp. TaxID=376 RepID=UPI002719364D|nr:ATP-binding protein [Bradyrhizobium sp.]MDO8400516.1 ATP-binding protein [Bradyrhizobium sp.]